MNYLITGSTGLIGKALIKILIERAYGDRVTLVLPVRDEARARDLLGDFIKIQNVNFIFVQCSLEQMTRDRFDLGFAIDGLIHCAAPTASLYMISNPVETADAIVLGTKHVLELARHLNVKSMVYLSSMEAYGVVADDGRLRQEEELGSIDLTSARSCYPLGKRVAEHYCHIYMQEYGVPVKIARLSQVFGKGVRPEDNRVFMQFARAAIEQKDIVLRTKGQSLGNYCATEDAVEAILLILEKGQDGQVYNVANEENTVSIYEMASLVASKVAGGRICVRIEEESNEKTGYAPKTGLRMSAEKIRGLGWKPKKGMDKMYEDVIEEINMANKTRKEVK